MRNLAATLDHTRPYQVFDRPIFILSAPRSGSTYLFELISHCHDVWRWHAELDDIWWNHFPYDRNDEFSDYVSGSEVTRVVARALRRDHFRYARWAKEERGEACGWLEKIGGRRVRFLDKTIANCFHLEVLEKVFPDALYLFLIRDPRATISSMMEGWCDPQRFNKPQLQALIDASPATIPHWSYPAPRGWQAHLDLPMEEICLWSWEQHVVAVDEFLRRVPAKRQLHVRYEDLLAGPAPTSERILNALDLQPTAALEAFLRERPLSRTTVSRPEADKWRRHEPELQRIVDRLAPWMERFGYGGVDAKDGAVELRPTATPIDLELRPNHH